MQSRNHNFPFGVDYNFGVDNVFTFKANENYIPIPTQTYFLITEDNNFLITENGDFLVTEY